MNTEKIYFEKASIKHQDIIFQWLAEPHMQEFWDNSQEHRDDILNFIHGRKQHYFYGTTQYWVAYIEDQPFCFILSDQLLSSQNLSEVHHENLSKIGHTIGLDFGIGNTAYIGKGLASLTLEAFVTFYQKSIDQKADTFFIDPDKNNPRAIHVYEKAGFKMGGNFIATEGAFKEQTSYLMLKKMSSVQLMKATLADYQAIQNMARFYVYDMSRYCGYISDEWALPKDGLYESYDFKNYFTDEARDAFLVKIKDELAGFVLLKKMGALADTEWQMSEFFILAKFQGTGIASEVANQIWKTHPERWEVSVIPENKRALSFWRNTISNFTKGHYKEEIITVDYDKHQPKRYIFSFDAKDQKLLSAYIRLKKSGKVEIVEITNQAETLCRRITQDLPEYFGIPSANEEYFKGVHSCNNLAAKN